MPILHVEGLSHSYGERHVLRNLSLAIAAGESVALLGPNGSGKSTLLRLVAGLLTPTAGHIALVGSAAAAGRPEVGIVFQESRLLPWRTVLRNVTLPLELSGESLPSARTTAEAALKRVGAGGLLDRNPAEISGGERGRVALARALVRQPSLLLLDEPASGLSVEETQNMRWWIDDIRRQMGITVLMVEHDMGLVGKVSDRVLALADGAKLAEGTPAEVQSHPAVIEAYLGTSAISKTADAKGART